MFIYEYYKYSQRVAYIIKYIGLVLFIFSRIMGSFSQRLDIIELVACCVSSTQCCVYTKIFFFKVACIVITLGDCLYIYLYTRKLIFFVFFK